MRTTTYRLAALLGATLLMLLALPVASSQARTAYDPNTVPVVGTVKRSPAKAGTPAQSYDVKVRKVLGPKTADAGSIPVQTTNMFRQCRIASKAIPRKRVFLVEVTRRSDGTFLVDECHDLQVDSPEHRREALERLAEPASPTPDPMPDMELSPRDVKPAPDFTRLAAPGLAVVIVGALGLVLVRRIGRS